MPRTLINVLKEFPPSKLRNLARHKGMGKRGHRMTYAEIGAKAGLHPKQIARMVKHDNWLSYKAIENMLRFWAGCGAEFFQLRRVREYVKNTNNLQNAEHVRFPNGRPKALSKRMRAVRRYAQ